MTDSVNEDTSRNLTVSFFDADGVAVIPASVSYRVDCETTGREVRDWTEFGGTLATSIEIELTSADNCILNQANETETRKVNVLTPEAHYEYEYTVNNLHYPIRPVIVQGDDYSNTDGRALKFTGGLGWPALDGSGASVLLTASASNVSTTLSKAGTIETATGRNKIVRVELTAAETAALDPSTKYKYKLTATLTTGGRQVTLSSGTLSVVER